MIKKFIVPFLLLVLVGYTGLSWFQLKTSNIEDLILCSVDRGGIYIPDSVCYWYLTSYRNEAEDLRQLYKSGGISFVLGVYRASSQDAHNIEIAEYNQRTLELADHFINNGIEINKVDENDGLTPLHKEILANNPELVKYLINKGADLTVKEQNNDLTPLEFAELLSTKNANIDRGEVLSILKNATKR